MGWRLYIDGNVLTFSPDGQLLALSERGTIRLWNPATGESVRQFEAHRDDIWALAFSPDGSLLASAGRDNAVTVWEVRPGKSPRPLTGVGHWLDLLGLAADGQTLLTRSAEGSLNVWDVRDGRRLRTLANGEDRIERFLFGPDTGRTLALLWQDVQRGRDRPAFSRERICCSAFAPDNALLAIGSVEDGSILLLRKTDEGIEHCRLEDSAPVQEAKKRRLTISVDKLTFSPDGRTLAATYSDGRLILWESRTGRPRHILSLPRHGNPYRCLEFSPDGRLLALSNRNALYLVESASGQRFKEWPLGSDWIDSVVFAPDNRTLAAGDTGPLATIRLWDLPTEKSIHVLRGHRDSVRTLAFSPDGTSLLSGSDDRTVLCWDVAAVMRRRVPSKKLSADQCTDLWTDLASKDASRAQRAVATFIQPADSTLPFLDKQLPPVSAAQMSRVKALIADLDHEEFTRREKASRELEKIAEVAAPALRQAVQENPSLEMRERIEAILAALDERPLSPERLRTIRALQVLETIGTPQAQRILEGLAHGAAEAWLTHEAKASLQRLVRRYAQP